MQDRRQSARRKTFLGARVAINQGHARLDCLLRNRSAQGAKLLFSGPVMVPDEFELEVAGSECTVRARVQWRGRDQLGVSLFRQSVRRAADEGQTSARIRRLEADKTRLEQRVVELTTGY